MTNLSKFKRDLEGAVAVRVDRASKQMTILAATVVLQQLTTIGLWPVDTGYSMANHKIGVGSDGIPGANPAEKPEDKNVDFRGLIESNKQQQLSKLTRLKRGDAVIVGNPVHYSPDVGFQSGQGRALYAEAARFASATVEAKKVTEETLARDVII